MHSAEDPYVILESLRRIRALGPARMFDAHRGFVERPIRAIDAKIQWLGEALQEIERLLAEGWTDATIVRRVLGGEDKVAVVSRGEYARLNLVRAVKRSLGGGATSAVHG